VGAPDGTGAAAPEAAARFPCGKCGADLLFDPRSRGLRCPFCGEARAVEASGAVAERDLDAALAAAAAAHAARPPLAEARRVHCEACGAVLAVPAGEASGRCPYCGSVRVLEEPPDPGRIPPEAVVPFAVDRAGAEALFRTWMAGLWFRPNALRSGSAVAEMRGVLVPFWTFDAAAASSWTAQSGRHYYVTVGAGKNARRVRMTSWSPASGSRRDAFDDLLVCASRGLDAGLVRKIEPFDLAALAPFRREFLAGWSAEGYAVDVREAWALAEASIREEVTSRCAGDVPGDTHRDLRVATTLSGKRYRHVLLPVWVCAYRWRNRPFRFLVNGQTGEVQGEAPWSWVKIGALVLGIAAAVAAAILLAGGGS
jgi:DNA-directed RNA polymerase subunit RPC12/RpoP